MRFSVLSSFSVVAMALALSACGGSGSEFATKVKASCEKSPQASTVDCGCVAAALDKELDDKTKAVMVAIEAASDAGKSPVDALKAAGVEESEAPALMAKLLPAAQKAASDCKKS